LRVGSADETESERDGFSDDGVSEVHLRRREETRRGRGEREEISDESVRLRERR